MLYCLQRVCPISGFGLLPVEMVCALGRDVSYPSAKILEQVLLVNDVNAAS